MIRFIALLLVSQNLLANYNVSEFNIIGNFVDDDSGVFFTINKERKVTTNIMGSYWEGRELSFPRRVSQISENRYYVEGDFEFNGCDGVTKFDIEFIPELQLLVLETNDPTSLTQFIGCYWGGASRRVFELKKTDK